MTDATGAGRRPDRDLTLLVPAYAHPVVAPGLWRRLVEVAPVLRGVVVNPASGPGLAVDPGYPPVLDRLREAGVRLLGYVDTGYATRPPEVVAAEVAAHRDLYGITGVFLDQVSSGSEALGHYAEVVRRGRALGAGFVVLNPGVHPDPRYLDLADVVVTFEGPWQHHRQAGWPGWTASVPPGRLCHLVHGLPTGAAAPAAYVELVARARAAGVRTLFATSGSGANPWASLPEELLAAGVPAAQGEPAGGDEPGVGEGQVLWGPGSDGGAASAGSSSGSGTE